MYSMNIRMYIYIHMCICIVCNILCIVYITHSVCMYVHTGVSLIGNDKAKKTPEILLNGLRCVCVCVCVCVFVCVCVCVCVCVA